MQFISHHEIEWGLIHDRVRAVIVGEFSVGDFVCLGIRVRPTEDLKICFNFLVNTFHFAIRLCVVGSGEGEVVVEEFAKLLGEGGHELWSTIRDNFIVESKMQVDFVEKETGYPFSSDCFLSRAENYPLHKAMVNHD